MFNVQAVQQKLQGLRRAAAHYCLSVPVTVPSRPRILADGLCQTTALSHRHFDRIAASAPNSELHTKHSSHATVTAGETKVD